MEPLNHTYTDETGATHQIALIPLPAHETADTGCVWCCRFWRRVGDGASMIPSCPACMAPETPPTRSASFIRTWYVEGAKVAAWQVRPGFPARAACRCGRDWWFDGAESGPANWDICPVCCDLDERALAARLCPITPSARLRLIADCLEAAGPDLLKAAVTYLSDRVFYLDGTWPDEQIRESMRDAAALLRRESVWEP